MNATRAARALQRECEQKTKPLLRGYLQTRIEEDKPKVQERLFVIDIDGTVLETTWRDFSTSFAKRAQFSQSQMTAEELLHACSGARDAIHFCGNYYID